MELLQRGFPQAAIELTARVCDEAWGEVQTAIIPSPNQSEEMLGQMIARVMAAVAAGEHEPCASQERRAPRS
jgi:hypothetical protein